MNEKTRRFVKSLVHSGTPPLVSTTVLLKGTEILSKYYIFIYLIGTVDQIC